MKSRHLFLMFSPLVVCLFCTDAVGSNMPPLKKRILPKWMYGGLARMLKESQPKEPILQLNAVQSIDQNEEKAQRIFHVGPGGRLVARLESGDTIVEGEIFNDGHQTLQIGYLGTDGAPMAPTYARQQGAEIFPVNLVRQHSFAIQPFLGEGSSGGHESFFHIRSAPLEEGIKDMKYSAVVFDGGPLLLARHGKQGITYFRRHKKKWSIQKEGGPLSRLHLAQLRLDDSKWDKLDEVDQTALKNNLNLFIQIGKHWKRPMARQPVVSLGDQPLVSLPAADLVFLAQ